MYTCPGAVQCGRTPSIDIVEPGRGKVKRTVEESKRHHTCMQNKPIRAIPSVMGDPTPTLLIGSKCCYKDPRFKNDVQLRFDQVPSICTRGHGGKAKGWKRKCVAVPATCCEFMCELYFESRLGMVIVTRCNKVIHNLYFGVRAISVKVSRKTSMKTRISGFDIRVYPYGNQLQERCSPAAEGFYQGCVPASGRSCALRLRDSLTRRNRLKIARGT